MEENTEKLTLKELEKKMDDMRAQYEEQLKELREQLAGAPKQQPVAPEIKKNASDAWLNEEVPIRLFKDGEKYKDDLTIGINGKLVKIRRGETVMVKRKYLMLIEQSIQQDEKTADLMNRESRRFETESRAYTA